MRNTEAHAPVMAEPARLEAARLEIVAEWMGGIGLILMPWIFAYFRFGLDFAVGLCGIGFLMHCAARRDWSWLRGPVGWMMGLWLFWMGGVVSPLAAMKPGYSLFYAITWLRYPLLFLAMTLWLLPNPRWQRRFWISLALAMAAIWLDTLIQMLFGTSLSGHATFDGRLTGPLRGPNVATLLIRLGLALAAMTCWTRPVWLQSHGARFLMVIFAFSAMILVLASGERGSLFLLLSTLLLMGIIGAWYRPQWCRALLLFLGMSVFISLMVFYFYPYAQGRLALLLRQIGHFEHTEYASLYRAGWGMVQASPMHGVGLRHFRWLCEQYMEPSMRLACAIHPHNYAWEWVIESGAVGLLIFYGLVAACIRPLWQYGCKRLRPCDLVPFQCFAVGAVWMSFYPFLPTQGNWNGWNICLSWLLLGTVFVALRETARRAASLDNAETFQSRGFVPSGLAGAPASSSVSPGGTV